MEIFRSEEVAYCELPCQDKAELECESAKSSHYDSCIEDFLASCEEPEEDDGEEDADGDGIPDGEEDADGDGIPDD